eukprot:TRINITY_DN40607_c0_g1_i1.p1 TRINITY_DN40607_c0_g1~~TRINITY_DN40607_c0_g1_i1.p1  ORF type:complete len:344 (+),score=65.84 TRINITY_DN40607_c0_g1_i1:80-1033(+)
MPVGAAVMQPTGVLVREGAELDSAELCVIPCGERVNIMHFGSNNRVKLEAPQGWISLINSRGEMTLMVDREGAIAASGFAGAVGGEPYYAAPQVFHRAWRGLGLSQPQHNEDLLAAGGSTSRSGRKKYSAEKERIIGEGLGTYKRDMAFVRSKRVYEAVMGNIRARPIPAMTVVAYRNETAAAEEAKVSWGYLATEKGQRATNIHVMPLRLTLTPCGICELGHSRKVLEQRPSRDLLIAVRQVRVDASEAAVHIDGKSHQDAWYARDYLRELEAAGAAAQSGLGVEADSDTDDAVGGAAAAAGPSQGFGTGGKRARR